MLVNIEDIKVNDRIRKDFGNIQELADDIKENGLINPPVVTEGLELIAGERRLRAMKTLGYNQIEVRPMSVKDAEHALNLEISENETRKDFSKAERIDYARRLERVEKIKAEQRILSKQNNKNGRQIAAQENFPEQVACQTRDVVAQKIGIGSGKQYEKEKFIVDHKESLTPDDFADWDEGKLSTNKAFLKIKKKNDSLKEKIKELENKLRSTSLNSDDFLEEINSYKKKLHNQEEYQEQLEQTIKTYEKESEQYKKLESELGFISLQKNDLSRKINSATELSGLTVKLQTILEKDLAPIKFKRCMEVLDSSEVAVENLCDIIHNIKRWINEIETFLPNNGYHGMEENIIDVMEEE